MLTVIIIMSAAMVVGFILRKQQILFKKLDQMVSYVIYLLLFLLGLSVGQNETILRNFHLVGLKALLISSASVAGSVLVAALVYKLFFKSEHKKTDLNSQEVPSSMDIQGDEA